MVVFCLMGYKDIIAASKYETVTRWDYRKVGQFIRGEWPGPLPELEVFTEEDWLGEDNGNN